jgi:hypothetical protein
VLFGSMVATTDGAVTERSKGYIWQPYEVCNFGHLLSADPHLLRSISAQRREWQKLGLLSKREYPAQILVTWSGERKHPTHDFLEARIFHEKLPNGNPMETYIITSAHGARNIRLRAADFNLQNRIDDMLITLPVPVADTSQSDNCVFHSNSQMDLSVLPQYLFEKLDIRVANHDGGRDVLRAFARAGILSQLNLTLCQERSVVDVLREGNYIAETGVDPSEYTDPALESKLQYFFDSSNFDAFCRSADSDGSLIQRRGVPRHLPVVEVTEGVNDAVMMVTLKANKKFDF